MLARLITGLTVAAFVVGCGGSSKTTATPPATQPVGAASGGGAAARQDADAKAEARTTVTALESCHTDAQTYTSCDLAKTLGNSAPPVGSGPGQVEVKPADQTYTIAAHSQSGDTFTISKNSGGSIQRTCTVSNPAGACRAGTW
jgi:hypothetical protein